MIQNLKTCWIQFWSKSCSPHTLFSIFMNLKHVCTRCSDIYWIENITNRVVVDTCCCCCCGIRLSIILGPVLWGGPLLPFSAPGLWLSMWFFLCPDVRKAASHWLHLKGLEPVWSLMCTLRVPLVANGELHRWQWNTFSSAIIAKFKMRWQLNSQPYSSWSNL